MSSLTESSTPAPTFFKGDIVEISLEHYRPVEIAVENLTFVVLTHTPSQLRTEIP